MSKVRFQVFVLVLLITGGLTAGCVSKFTKQLMDTESVLKSTQEAGVKNAPAYDEAVDLIARAKLLMREGKETEALGLLEEAKFKAIEGQGKMASEQFMEGKTEDEMQKEVEMMGSHELKSSARLKGILFDYDSAKITSHSKKLLDKNAKYIMKKMKKSDDHVCDVCGGSAIIVIEGYADVRGTEEYNLALGQRRADSVMHYLIGKGVSPEMIKAISKGETEKWSSGTSDYAYSQNRRAHFVTH